MRPPLKTNKEYKSNIPVDKATQLAGKCVVYYEVITKALAVNPFYIRCGEKYYYDENRREYVNAEGKKLPSFFNIHDETSFKKGEFLYPFMIGDLVHYTRKKEPGNRYSKTLETNKGTVVGLNNTTAIIRIYNSDKTVVVDYNYIKKIDTYWFISSVGQVQSAVVGKDESADKYRQLTNNYFSSKDLALAERDSYIQCLIDRKK